MAGFGVLLPTLLIGTLAWLLLLPLPRDGPQPVDAGWPQAPRLVLVLGAGGPRGFAHLGVLQALEELGVRPDAVVGASIGAVVGALWLSGHSAAEIRGDAFDFSILHWLDMARDGTLRLRGERLGQWLQDRTGATTIEALPRPLAVVATEADSGREAVFTRGDLGLAVRASAAAPDSFAPVTIGAARYIDADRSSPLPIDAARRLGARVVVAVDVSAHLGSTPHDVPESWREGDRRMRRLADAQKPGADLVIHPDLGYYAGMSDGYRRRTIELGYRATLAQAARLRELAAAAPQ